MELAEVGGVKANVTDQAEAWGAVADIKLDPSAVAKIEHAERVKISLRAIHYVNSAAAGRHPVGLQC